MNAFLDIQFIYRIMCIFDYWHLVLFVLINQVFPKLVEQHGQSLSQQPKVSIILPVGNEE